MKKKQLSLNCIFVIAAIVISMLAAVICCVQKVGFHEDEYYSYYSSQRTTGLYLDDDTWKPREEIYRELTVLPGEGFRYGLVKEVQSWDVHPPMYYFLLHTVCSVFPGTFSKWAGLGINLIAFLIGLLLLYKLTGYVTKSDYAAPIVLLLYGLTPAALSGVTFIRMYAVLTVFVLWAAILHCKNIDEEKLSFKGFYIPLALCTYFGFLTQYYYFIFLFFAAACFCLYRMFCKKQIREVLTYAGTMVLVFGLAYVTYPAFPGQMFRGQRGAQATASFFDLSNTLKRILFYGGLINRMVFAGLFPVLLIVLLYLFVMERRSEEKKALRDYFKNHPFWFLLGTICGYFFVVSKTGLLLGDSSIRYQMPIYGILILLCVTVLLKRKGLPVYVFLLGLVLSNLYGICTGDVLFLYREDKGYIEQAKDFAKEEIPVVYFYNGAQTWCVWDAADELLEYPEIYFTEQTKTEPISDAGIENAEKLVVYIANLADEETAISRVLSANENLHEYELLHEDSYCSAYLFR